MDGLLLKIIKRGERVPNACPTRHACTRARTCSAANEPGRAALLLLAAGALRSRGLAGAGAGAAAGGLPLPPAGAP